MLKICERSKIEFIDLRILGSVGRKSPTYICIRAPPLTDKATHRVGIPSRHDHEADIPTS